MWWASALPSASARRSGFSYEQTVRLLKWLTLALFAYVAVILAVSVPWKRAIIESIEPWSHLPAGTPSARDYAAIIVAVLGTTINPYLFFWQASQEVEDSHRRPNVRELRKHAEPSTCRGSSRTPWSAWGFPT